MNKWQKVVLFVALPALAGFVLVCGLLGAVLTGGDDDPVNASTAVQPVDGQPAEPVEQADNIYAYGETALINGMAITLTPTDYTPDQYAAGWTGGAATAFVLRLQNSRTDGSTVEPLVDLYISATQSGGQPAERIFDSANGVTLEEGELFPGEVSEWKVAFDGEVTRVKIEGFLDWTSDPIYFTNSG